jgi:hypothetical protein
MPTFPHDDGQSLIKRIAKAYMAHDAAFKESKRPNTLCAINNLIRHNKIPRSNLLLKTSNSRKRNDSTHTNMSQGCDIGTARDLMWCEFVVQAVSGKKGDWNWFAR